MSDPLEALRARFIDRCRDDLARLETLAGDEAEAALIVHRLAGAAGAFGFPGLSRIAAEIDRGMREGRRPSHGELEGLRAGLADAIRSSR